MNELYGSVLLPSVGSAVSAFRIGINTSTSTIATKLNPLVGAASISLSYTACDCTYRSAIGMVATTSRTSSSTSPSTSKMLTNTGTPSLTFDNAVNMILGTAMSAYVAAPTPMMSTTRPSVLAQLCLMAAIGPRFLSTIA